SRPSASSPTWCCTPTATRKTAVPHRIPKPTCPVISAVTARTSRASMPATCSMATATSPLHWPNCKSRSRPRSRYRKAEPHRGSPRGVPGSVAARASHPPRDPGSREQRERTAERETGEVGRPRDCAKRRTDEGEHHLQQCPHADQQGG